MGAKPGNQYALGNDGGRPTVLTEEVVAKVEGYLAWVDANPIAVGEEEKPRLPNVERCALNAGVSARSLKAWGEGEMPEAFRGPDGGLSEQGLEFSRRIRAVLDRVADSRKAVGLEYAAVRVLDGNFTRFVLASENGMREQLAVDHTSRGEQISQVTKLDDQQLDKLIASLEGALGRGAAREAPAEAGGPA